MSSPGENPPADRVEIRPRSTGEILDDAWRLAMRHAPVLLLASGVWTVPAAVALLVLLAVPPSAWARPAWLMPGITAVLLPLTGLASGAVQGGFRLAVEGRPVEATACWRASLRRGLDHVAARSLLLVASGVAAVCLVLPGLALWAAAAVVHPTLAAGKGRLGAAWRAARRDVRRQAGKYLTLAVVRPLVFLVVVVNLHGLVRLGLWLPEQFGGFDVGFLGASLQPANAVYDLVLALSAWVLLVPYFEAVNYFLYVDGRARFEGLDLRFRIRRLFAPPAGRAAAGAVLVLLAAAGGARPAEVYERVRATRQEIGVIRQEVQAAEPYPGGARWAGRLEAVGRELDPQGSATRGRWRWYWKEIAEFGPRGRGGALEVLDRVDQRLQAVEEASRPAEGGRSRSTAEIRNLLPALPAEVTPEKPDRPPPPPPPRQEPAESRGPLPGVRGPGVVAPLPVGGFGAVGWAVVAGLLAVVIVLGLVTALRGRGPAPPKPAVTTTASGTPSVESILSQPDRHTASALWQRADDAARQGRWLEGVRLLHLAVLALLHRADLIRFEPTRTNGEYVRQLRPRAELQGAFRDLTAVVERKWYGTRSCAPDEFAACRGMAEGIRERVSRAST